jgi:two-component system, sensor histidine kinase and response regulator
MLISEFFDGYFNDDQTEAGRRSRLFTVFLESWAAEKDHELRNELLNDLVLQYSSTIRKLVDLNQLKSKFLRIAAHDLRNPLASVRGLSEILLNEAAGPLTPDQKEYLDVINAASDRMLALVDDLLDISVIESGKLDMQLKKGSLEKVIEERIRIHKVFADEKRISLRWKYADLPQALFDPSKIAQVIDNLLGNAIKYSPFDSIIYTLVELKNGMVMVSVKDEGPGIPEEDRARIFREFQKLRLEPTGGEKSTGLGLAIARKIVEAHRGRLQVESQVGLGSTFSFTLPLG